MKKYILFFTYILFICQAQMNVKTQTLSTSITLPSENNIARDRVNLNGNFRTTGSGRFYAGTNELLSIYYDYKTSNLTDEDYKTTQYPQIVGSSDSKFQVEKGVPKYSLNIAVSPGINDISPNLAISYKGTVVNDILGLGFGLDGLSQINLVNISNTMFSFPQTYDKSSLGFVMDGKPIYLTTSTSEFGNTDGIYKTANENNFYLKLYGGTSTSLPSYFKLFRSDGAVIEYGNSLDSKDFSRTYSGTNNQLVNSWKINKITDKDGNFMTFKYDHGSSTGLALISEIKYTGNENSSTIPKTKISFVYSSKQDFSSYFFKTEFSNNESFFVKDRLLSKIILSNNEEFVRAYDFYYTFDNLNKCSKLYKIEERGEGMSFKPTTFKWGNPPTSYLNTEKISMLNANYGFNCAKGWRTGFQKTQIVAGDFDGNGYTDFVQGEGNVLKIYLDGNIDEVSSTVITTNVYDPNTDITSDNFMLFNHISAIDIDADGTEELCLKSNNLNKVLYQFYKITKLNNVISLEKKTEVISSDYVFFHRNKDNSFETIKFDINGKILSPQKYINKLNFNWSSSKIFKTDINGNGLLEFTSIKGTKTITYEWDIKSSTFIKIYDSDVSKIYFSSSDNILCTDINNDGNTDFITINSLSKDVLYYLSTGSSFLTARNIGKTSMVGINDNRLIVCDLNSDGKNEMIYPVTDNTLSSDQIKWVIKTYSSDSFIEVSSFITAKWHDISVLDYNFDGYLDIVYKPGLDVEVFHENLDIVDKNNQAIPVYYVKASTPNLTELPSFYEISILLVNGTEFQNSLHINEISNGFETQKITYSSLSNKITPIYTKKLPSNSKIHILGLPTNQVVSKVETVYPHKIVTTNYFYTDLMYEKNLKTILGYGSEETSNELQNLCKKTNFTYFDGAMLLPTEIIKSDYLKTFTQEHTQINYVIDAKSMPTTGNFTNQPYTRSWIIEENFTKSNFVNNTRSVENKTFDSFGNCLTNEIKSFNGTLLDYYQKTENTYISKYLNMNLYLSQSESKFQYKQQPIITKLRTWEYDNVGHLVKEVKDKGSSNELYLEYNDYNLNGNFTKIKIYDQKNTVSLKQYVYEYDESKRYITKVTNPIEQSETYEYDKSGNIVKFKDVDDLTINFVYDGLGNISSLIDKRGLVYYYSKSLCTNGETGYYKNTITSTNKPIQTIYFNADGSIATQSVQSLNGIVYSDFIYDSKGFLIKKSKPYLEGTTLNSNYFTEFVYDQYGRIVSTKQGLKNTYYSYNNLSTKIQYPDGSTKEVSLNTLGNYENVKDKLGVQLNYNYNSLGQIVEISKGGTSFLKIDYDAEFHTPNKFTSINFKNPEYKTYDRFLRLKSYVSPKNITTIYSYDNTDKLLSETTNGVIKNYTYNSKNQITDIVKNSENEHYEYNVYSELTKLIKTTSDGNVFQYNLEYDMYGNLSKLTYPSSFTTKYVYTDDGILKSIHRNDNDELIWKVDQLNAMGQPTKSFFGKNLIESIQTFDPIYDVLQNKKVKKSTGAVISEHGYAFNIFNNNLELKSDLLKNLTESYTYDQGDRLTKVNTNGVNTLNIDYDNSTGNIISKSDVGTYQYGSPQIFATSKVSNSSGKIPTVTQLVDYNDFNKVSSIVEGSKRYQIFYGIDDERSRTELLESGTVLKTTYYAGLYEKEVTTSGTKETHYIPTGEQNEAIYVKTTNSSKLYFAVKDHINSNIALINEEGTIEEEYSYDAWGKRRNPTTWTSTTFTEPSILTRGYTGHEHIKEFNLINMNGRIYDPIMAKFLSVDPVISDITNSQRFNAFSYVLNNPLKFYDPTGFDEVGSRGGQSATQVYSGLNNNNQSGNGTSGSSSGNGSAGSASSNPTSSSSGGTGGNNNNGINMGGPTPIQYIYGPQGSSSSSSSSENKSIQNTGFQGSKNTVKGASTSTNAYKGPQNMPYYPTKGNNDSPRQNFPNNNHNSSHTTTMPTNDKSLTNANSNPKNGVGYNFDRFIDDVELSSDLLGPVGKGSDNILKNRGAYMPRGEIYKVNKAIIVKTPLFNVNTTSKVLNFARVGGKVLGVANFLATGYEIRQDLKEGKYKSAGARTFVYILASGSTAIPVVGWGVSMGIGVLEYKYGDDFYEWVEK